MFHAVELIPNLLSAIQIEYLGVKRVGKKDPPKELSPGTSGI
jgi:hypothetical protein